MDRTEFIGKLRMCYFGEKRAFEEIMKEYDRLNNIINGIQNKCNDELKEYEKGKGKYNEYYLEQYCAGLKSAYIGILKKLQELKEGNNENNSI